MSTKEIGEDELSRLDQCKTAIDRAEGLLAKDGTARLLLHKEIGDQLITAKSIHPKGFIAWFKANFPYSHQWRAGHICVAKRWDEIESARAWAREAGSPLAEVYSVDGVRKLLDAWDEAIGRAAPKKTRAASKSKQAGPAGERLSIHPEVETETSNVERLLDDHLERARNIRKELNKELNQEVLDLGSDLQRRLEQIAGEYNGLLAEVKEKLRERQNSSGHEIPLIMDPVTAGENPGPSIPIAPASRRGMLERLGRFKLLEYTAPGARS
jgi:hypothetical protein